MGTLGHRLRIRREDRGLRRVDAARATRVGAHHLAALEHDDLDELFEDERAEAWVRAYADYLGLDSEEAVAEFLSAAEARGGAVVKSTTEEPQTPEVSHPADENEESTVVASPASSPPMSGSSPPSLEADPVAAIERDDSSDASPDTRDLAGRRPDPISPHDVAEQLYGTASAEPPRVATDVAEPPPAPAGEAPGLVSGFSSRWVVIAGVCVVILVLAWLGLRGEPSTGPPPTNPTPEVPRAVADAAVIVPPVEPSEPIEPSSAESIEPDARPPIESDDARSLAPVIPRAGALVVDEHGVGTGVEDRRLVGEASRFEEGDQVWYWTRVRGGSPGTKIRHVWIREGRWISSTTLEIGSANWRTQSRKTLFPGSAGHWTVETRDETDRVLSSAGFTCVKP